MVVYRNTLTPVRYKSLCDLDILINYNCHTLYYIFNLLDIVMDTIRATFLYSSYEYMCGMIYNI